MVADVAGEPMQPARQVVEGAAFDPRALEVPLGMFPPVGVLELVLHVEEPDADGPPNQHDWHLHQQEAAPSQRRAGHGDQHGRGRVRPGYASPLLAPVVWGVPGKSMLDEELPSRAEDQEHEEIPAQPIPHPTPTGRAQVLLDSQCLEVAEAAPVEIPEGRMVDRVRAAPVVIRHEHEHPEHRAQHVVGAPGTEERSVTAVVLDDEQAHQQARRRHRQEKCQGPRDIQRSVGQAPYHRVERDGAGELPARLADLRMGVWFEQMDPVSGDRTGRHVGEQAPALDPKASHGSSVPRDG